MKEDFTINLHFDDPYFFSEVKKKPGVGSLQQEALLIQEIRPSLHMEKPTAINKMACLWKAPCAVAERIGKCASGVFRFSSVGWGPSLCTRNVTLIFIPSNQNKVYIEESLDSYKKDETRLPSPHSPTDSSISSFTPLEDKRASRSSSFSSSVDIFSTTEENCELEPELINRLQQKIEQCRQGHEEVHEVRKILLIKQNKDTKLEKQGYQKTIHKRPILTFSLKKAKAIDSLMEKVAGLDSFFKRKEGTTPAKEQLVSQIKVLKQLIVLEEKLNRNLTLVNAKSLYKEFKLEPGEENYSKWEAICHHFEIEDESDLESQWQALGEKTQEDIKNFTLALKRK